ncbi:hypothetical protein PoB_000399700 [Plakobranchus ocellatus]|uniref:Uncharacterized protein n=1 Tax=Plakobranchus ocellatus TaxID=259542 RepID=A0AAV3Y451_9GAST|nr:hypothetical protein PoB_000399700 [Plakobranchus ocellatus]
MLLSSFGVPPATLFDKLYNRYPMEPSSRKGLTIQEEDCLVELLKKVGSMGQWKGQRRSCCYCPQKILHAKGYQTPFKDNVPGRKWLQSFLKWLEELRERKTMVLREQRKGFSKKKLQAGPTSRRSQTIYQKME